MQEVGLRRVGWAFAAIAAMLLSAPAAVGGGVSVHEHGRGLGNAYAGRSAGAEDASTAFWNPAGMTRLHRHQVVGAAYLALPTTEFRDSGSLDATGAALRGGNGGNGAESIVLPSFFAVVRASPRVRVGLSVNVPYGLATDYGETWLGRYQATRSAIETINIGTSIGYRVNRRWSVGAGVDVQHVSAELSSMIDLGTLGFIAGIPGLTPQANDGKVEISGDDWSVGFNAGVLFEPSPRTRVGIHYRSRIKHSLEGKADFTVPVAAAPLSAATGAFVDTGAKVDLTLPDTLSVSVWHTINARWAVMADVQWTNWSTFASPVIGFDNPAQAAQVLVFDWHDTMRYAVGAMWTPMRRWSFRAGLAYDESPIPDRTRTARIPGNDRVWTTFGVGYRVNSSVQVDFSYGHIFIRDGNINQLRGPAGLLLGHNETGIDLVGAQVTVDL